jgi:hypothetical protein
VQACKGWIVPVMASLALAACGSPAPPLTVRAAPPGMVRAAASEPSGTLYAAEERVVHAYPLDSNGTVTAARTIVPHPNQDQYIIGLAVNGDASLDILEQYYAGGVEAASSGFCRVVVEPATADGVSLALGTHLCGDTESTIAFGIATNVFGGYDVLYYDTTSNAAATLRRFATDGTTVVDSFSLSAYADYLATDRAGRDYLFANQPPIGEIQVFKKNVADSTQTEWDATFVGRGFGPVAVSPGADRTAYTADGAYIRTILPGLVYGSVSLGPFKDNRITAMAVDQDGSLYVALYPNAGTSGSFIRVYASGANGKPPPVRTIVPAPAITGPITALAVGP